MLSLAAVKPPAALLERRVGACENRLWWPSCLPVLLKFNRLKLKLSATSNGKEDHDGIELVLAAKRRQDTAKAVAATWRVRLAAVIRHHNVA